VISVPHMAGRHWRLDFNRGRKPYLLAGSNNNMGADTQAFYRSSAQEWLDEKAEWLAAGQTPRCELPFAMHLVVRQVQHDEITGNTLRDSNWSSTRGCSSSGKDTATRGSSALDSPVSSSR